MSSDDQEGAINRDNQEDGAPIEGQKRTGSKKLEEGQELVPTSAGADGKLAEIEANSLDLPIAEYTGELQIGDKTLSCAVLDDGRRILSERSVSSALGSGRSGSHWVRVKDSSEDDYRPVFISAGNLNPFVPRSLALQMAQPIKYRTAHGSKASANGVDATLLPEICEVWLAARRTGALKPSQSHIARSAEILQSGLAKVGIVALVDEATGYQEVRRRDELSRILALYISPELLPWTKRFPDEFYRELFRLRGWSYDPLSVKRPVLVGKLTNLLIYKQLPQGVLDELKQRNPIDADGHRKHYHHQFLTEDVGDVHLERQIVAATTLMRISSSWQVFKRLFDRAFPKDGQLSLPGVESEEDEEL